jgi:hypothetical protein
MRVLSMDGSRKAVEPIVRFTVGLRALSTRVRVCAPPVYAAHERAAPVAIDVISRGGRQ